MNKAVIGLLILIFLALVANLVYVAVEDRSFVDSRMVPYGLFGILVLADVLVSVAGFLFVNKAHGQHEKSSFVWARRAYIATFVVILLLSMAPWVFIEVGKDVGSRADALLNMSIILLLIGVPIALFTMAYYLDFRRVSGSRSGGRDR